MPETAFQRARQPEQKAERRAHVLATARTIVSGGLPLEDISLNEIARRAGMAKSNVYRYFETREAVLIALLEEEMAELGAHIVATCPRARSLEPIVRHLAASLAARPMLCALVTAVPNVLERNLGIDAIRAFKLGTLHWLREVGRFLAARVPALSADAYAALLYDATALVGGLYPAAHSTAEVARVSAEPALAPLRRDLGRDLERMMLALARDRLR